MITDHPIFDCLKEDATSGDDDEHVHVYSLPPPSVVMSPVKMTMNRTTPNARWSVPRSREARRIQKVLMTVLDDDVDAVRKKKIGIHNRRVTAERLLTLKRKGNQKTAVVSPQDIRQDRCSTCEFLDLDICVHDAYAYAKRYTKKRDTMKQMRASLRSQKSYLRSKIKGRAGQHMSRPNTASTIPRRKRWESSASPRVSRATLRPSTALKTPRRNGRDGEPRFVEGEWLTSYDTREGGTALLPVSPLAPRYNKTWVDICNDAENPVAASRVSAAVVTSRMGAQVKGLVRSLCTPSADAPKPNGNNGSEEEKEFCKPDFIDFQILYKQLGEVYKEAFTEHSDSYARQRALKETIGPPQECPKSTTMSPVRNIDLAEMEDHHQITDSEAQWMQETFSNIGKFCSLDVYGMMKLREARYVSKDSRVPCRLVTDLSVVLLEKVLLNSSNNRTTSPRGLAAFREQQLHILTAKVLFHLMHSIYDKGESRNTFFSSFRNVYNRVHVVLQPSCDKLIEEAKLLLDTGDRVRQGMNKMVKRWQKPLLQCYFMEWRISIQSNRREDKFKSLLTKVNSSIMHAMGLLAMRATTSVEMEKTYRKLLKRLVFREWAKYAVLSKLHGLHRGLDQVAMKDKDAAMSLMQIKEEIQSKRKEMVVIMSELKDAYEHIEKQRAFLHASKWRLENYDESRAIGVTRGFIKLTVPAYKFVRKLMEERPHLLNFSETMETAEEFIHHGIFDNHSCAETFLEALCEEHHEYSSVVESLPEDLYILVEVLGTNGPVDKTIHLMDLIFPKVLAASCQFAKTGIMPDMAFFSDELKSVGQRISDRAANKSPTADDQGGVVVGAGEQRTLETLVMQSRIALAAFQAFKISNAVHNSARELQNKQLAMHLTATVESHRYHVVSGNITDRVARSVYLVDGAAALSKKEFQNSSHKTVLKWGVTGGVEMESLCKPLKDYNATDEQLKIKNKTELKLNAETDTWAALATFRADRRSQLRARKNSAELMRLTDRNDPVNVPFFLWESFESHRMGLPMHGGELLACLHETVKNYIPYLRGIYRKYSSGFMMKSQDFQNFVKDCKLAKDSGAKTDLIFVKVAKAQYNLDGLNDFEKNTTQLSRPGFVEAVVLLYTNKHNLQGQTTADAEKSLKHFFAHVVSVAKRLDRDSLNSKMADHRILRVLVSHHAELATIFQAWAGSTWKGPPLKNWQRSLNVGEWMSFLKQNGLLDNDNSDSTKQRAKERHKRMTARTFGAENLNAIAELTEESMQKVVQIRQVSQLSARKIFTNACGQGQTLDLEAVVSEAGPVRGRHNAERWDLLSFYDEKAARKFKGADDAATKEINRAETMDTRAFVCGLAILAEYQQPDPFTSLDEKLNDLLKITVCTKEAMQKL
jgi:hypothetical protein